MNKALRHLKIKEMLQRHQVSNQHELLRLLNESAISVAQATLSRDCGELGVVRARTNDGYRLTVPGESHGRIIQGLVGMEVLAINANETVVTLKTLPGRAHGVGSFLDQLKSPLILGTIAGDDTVLVIPSSIRQISSVISYIQDSLSQT